MAKTGRYYHEVVNTTDVAVTDTFTAPGKTDINLNDCQPTIPGLVSGDKFAGRLEGLVVRVKSIAGGATKLVIKITHAANGTQVVVPDTEATIGLEVGTLTEGGVAYKFDFPYLHTDDALHIFYKTDVAASTLTVDALEFYWSE